MKFNKYIAKSDKIDGKIFIAYRDQVLYSVIIETKDGLTDKQAEKLLAQIPNNESEIISAMAHIGLTVTGEQLNEKIALFARMYEASTGIKYKITSAEVGKIKLIEMDEELLSFYFSTNDFKLREKSVSNYVKYYNYIRQLINNPDKYVKPEFPNEYNAAFERNLSGHDIARYRQHLKDRGWTVTQRPGQAEHWTKPQQ